MSSRGACIGLLRSGGGGAPSAVDGLLLVGIYLMFDGGKGGSIC